MKGWRIAIVVLLIAILTEFSMLQNLQQEEVWEPPQQQEESETSQAPWQQESWKQLQEEFSKSAQKRKAVESAENQTENQTENHIKSNVDYTSYLEMTDSPHIIVDSYGSKYIVGSFKNISSVELDSVALSFRLYDKDGNQIDNADEFVFDLLPGKTWKYETYISKEASYFELAEINVDVYSK